MPFLTPQEEHALNVLFGVMEDRLLTMRQSGADTGPGSAFEDRQRSLYLIQNMVKEFSYLSTYARRPAVQT